MELEIGMEMEQLAALESRIAKLDGLREQLALESRLSQGLALEAETVVGNAGLLNHYYSGKTESEKLRISMEELSGGVIAMIAAGIAGMVAIIVKCVRALRSGSSSSGHYGGYTGTPAQVKGAEQIIGDKEMQRAVDDAMAASEEAKPAMEDFRHPAALDIVTVFEKFKESLRDPEVDFLTSERQSIITANVVDGFVHGNYDTYIHNYANEVMSWGEAGLQQAPHVGKDKEETSVFINEERNKLAVIGAKYRSTRDSIQALSDRYLDQHPRGSLDKLHLYFNKPSALFPFLEQLWKNCHFDKVKDDEKRLIDSLEEVQQKYEQIAKEMHTRSTRPSDNPWPAEDEMLRVIYHAHRELVRGVAQLARIGMYIKRAMVTAYRATIKAFDYILHVTEIIYKMPNVDRVRVLHARDIVKQRRQELMGLAAVE